MEKQKEMQDAHLQLSKSSTEEQLKQYFMRIVELNQSSEEFPINLDDIWPIGYTRKNNAVRDLKNAFYEGEDFIIKKRSQSADSQSLLKFEQQKIGGDFSTKDYYLSVSCAEYLIVRKCRRVFEVYRRVFHQVVNGGIDLMGMGKYYTITEYCQMFGKSKNSFYGLMASYREEFAMIGHIYYISKALCKMLEMRNNAERIRASIREKTVKRQLELQFKED